MPIESSPPTPRSCGVSTPPWRARAVTSLVKELLKLPELSDFDARVGSKDYEKLYRTVVHFFGHRRRTCAQIRAANDKAYAKKGPRVRPRPK